MYFQHANAIWSDHPDLVAGVVLATGVDRHASLGARVDELGTVAQRRLTDRPEGEFPEIRAWRRTFSRMGLKPTQYRCASESLLRRLRKEGALPSIHPVIDLCNAASMAFAIPVGVFDVDRIPDDLEVRHAEGDEEYLTFSGATERPEPHEVIFADTARRAHARRWTNRQSGYSAVRDATSTVLIVAEALHDSAAADVARLTDTIADVLAGSRPTTQAAPRKAILTRSAPRFAY